MSMYKWAERECRIACAKENPEYNFDSDEFDYGCSCYKSALKAYKSLMEDGHSGASFGFTANILKRLIDGNPLAPITDKDFFSVKLGSEEYPLESPDYLKEKGLKSHIQCPRKLGLFRTETIDGVVTYSDIDRVCCVDIECPSDTYHTNTDFIDKMFPITMPYMPKKGKYKVFTQTFLTDVRHGDFDTKGFLYVITPEGERVDINIFKTEGENGRWIEIPKDEYDKLLAHRIDKLAYKIADHLIWTLVSNSSSDTEIERREKCYKKLSEDYKRDFRYKLEKLCSFYDNPEHYHYNTFNMTQALCKREVEAFKDVPQLVEIHEHLQELLSNLK